MEQNATDEQFIKGFNDGYLLSRYEPDLMKQLMKNQDTASPYFEGMSEGQQTVNREIFEANLEKSRAMMQQQQKRPRMR